MPLILKHLIIIFYEFYLRFVSLISAAAFFLKKNFIYSFRFNPFIIYYK